MLRVSVKSAETAVKAGTSARTQKPYRIVEQEAYVSTFDPKTGKPRAYPERMTFALEDGQPPYPVGEYQIDPASVYVDRFGGLSFGRIKLLPLVASATRAA